MKRWKFVILCCYFCLGMGTDKYIPQCAKWPSTQGKSLLDLRREKNPALQKISPQIDPLIKHIEWLFASKYLPKSRAEFEKHIFLVSEDMPLYFSYEKDGITIKFALRCFEKSSYVWPIQIKANSFDEGLLRLSTGWQEQIKRTLKKNAIHPEKKIPFYTWNFVSLDFDSGIELFEIAYDGKFIVIAIKMMVAEQTSK